MRRWWRSYPPWIAFCFSTHFFLNSSSAQGMWKRNRFIINSSLLVREITCLVVCYLNGVSLIVSLVLVWFNSGTCIFVPLVIKKNMALFLDIAGKLICRGSVSACIALSQLLRGWELAQLGFRGTGGWILDVGLWGNLGLELTTCLMKVLWEETKMGLCWVG